MAEIQKKKKERRDESLKKSEPLRGKESQNESLTDTICDTYLHDKEGDAGRMAILQAFSPDSQVGKTIEISTREFLDARPGPISNFALIDSSFED
jgi:hypothetical protein